MRWNFLSAESSQVQELARTLSENSALRLKGELASTVARLLVVRQIADPESAANFLAPSLQHLHSPYSMTGMQAAVDRLAAAIGGKTNGPLTPAAAAEAA